MPRREAHEARRARLAARLGNRPALIAAGVPRPRNYAANLYPYRASSHFLYLFGVAAARRGRDLRRQRRSRSTCRRRTPTRRCGKARRRRSTRSARRPAAAVRPLDRLPASVRGRAVATLPAPDVETCLEQSRLLGRDIRRGVIDVLDAPLADAIIELRLHHDDAAQRRAAPGRRRHGGRARGRHGARPAPGRTAADVRAAMEAALMARGMGCAYPSIVTPHGEILHSERYDAAPRRRRSAARRRGRRNARRLGRRRDAHLARVRALLVHAAGDLRGGARRAEAGDRRGDAGQPLPQRSRARLPGAGRRAGRSRHPARQPDRAGGRRRGRAVVPARHRPPAGPRRARHGRPRRPRRLRARTRAREDVRAARRCASTATWHPGWP